MRAKRRNINQGTLSYLKFGPVYKNLKQGCGNPEVPVSKQTLSIAMEEWKPGCHSQKSNWEMK
jgi:hypothetical protein